MRHFHFLPIGLLVLSVAIGACSTGTVTWPDGDTDDADTEGGHGSDCSPRCREGFGCVDGECTTCCNPPCDADSICVCPEGEFCGWGEVCDGYWQCEELDAGIDADREADADDADVSSDADLDAEIDADEEADADIPEDCPAGGVCEPEAIDTRPCDCGDTFETRVCREDCSWGDWSGCPAGDCEPGASRSCEGACGEGLEHCNDSCIWGPCDAPATGECEPGASRACVGACGEGTERCSDLCAWGPCDAPATGECTPGTSRSCEGACGDGFERCTDLCAWGACDAPTTGECMPGATTTCAATCGTTGTRRCSDSCEWGACVPPVESCNGRDDDCDGVIDDDVAGCWRTIYRFETSRGWTPEARCLGTSRSAPPACSTYSYEREAFIIHATRVAGTFEARQCSLGTDHIVVDDRTGDRAALETAGYNCSLVLGYPYIRGSGPPAHQVPFSHTCPLYRFRFSTPEGGAHLFTRGPELMGDLTCEAPARADVHSTVGCFAGVPAGC